jgi:zinc transport system substrate-binding protein
VYAVNYPLAYFARRIGGTSVEVVFPVPRDVDPAHWDPTAKDITAVQSANLILLNGADYAKWTLRTTLPWSRTVVTTRDVEDQLIEVPDAVTHSHGPEGDHTHAALASETWLDPQLAIAQAQVVREELENLVPDASDSIKANFDALVNDLQHLDEQLNAAFSGASGIWTAADMAFSYLGRRYSVDLPVMHWDPGTAPTREQWEKFEQLRAGRSPSWMIWPDDPIPQTVDRLHDLGVGVIVFHPAARQPETGDYLSVMQDNVERLRGTMAKAPTLD